MLSNPMLLSISLVAFLSCIVHGRITFTKSEVLDNVDLKGTNTAKFRCAAGCRVYSPTKNANIVIVDSAGKEGAFSKSLTDLSTLQMGQSYELPPINGGYQLLNRGMADPAFLFYAVEKGASNYATGVVYVDAATTTTITAKSDAIVTVLSSSGAVHLSGWQGDFSTALPTVHTAPFDSIASCRAVYTASSPSTIANTAFPVYSPIATINFKKTGDRSVVVTGDYSSTASTVSGSSTVYSSLGYVGCNSVGDSLYTLLPRVFGIDSMTYLNDNGGLIVAVNGDYNIAQEAYAVQLNINGQESKLYGKNTISKTYDAVTNMKVIVSWTYHEGSTDRFALQIDVTAKGPVGPVIVPTKGPNPPAGSETTPKVQVTTSPAHLIEMFTSVFAVVLFCLAL